MYRVLFVQAVSQQDPTDGGRNCDFCQWESLTAEDTFGRCGMSNQQPSASALLSCDLSNLRLIDRPPYAMFPVACVRCPAG